MKRFFQILTLPFVWGWKILSSGLSVLVNLLFLASLVAVLSLLLYQPPVTVPDGAALVLAPEGSIVEKRSPIDPLTRVINRLAGGPLSEDVALQDLLDTIDHAADDSRIKLLLLKPGRIGSLIPVPNRGLSKSIGLHHRCTGPCSQSRSHQGLLRG